MNALALHPSTQEPAGQATPMAEESRHASVLTDREFLDELEKHKDAFYRFVRRTAYNASTVDDIFSSAVLAAYENRHKFVRGTNFRAWMYRILLNKCYVANRESARTLQPSDGFEAVPSPDAPHAPWQSFYDLDDVLEACGEEVSHAFQHLSFAQRTCLLLRFVEQLSYREIAEVLEMPIGTVTTHLARGRRRLRSELAGYAKRRGLLAAKRGRVASAAAPVFAQA